MTRWLTIVGMGEDGLDGLSAPARAAIEHADALVGSDRLLGKVPDDERPRATWPTPFNVKGAIERFRGCNVVALATGDPLWYGAARAILESYPAGEVSILPHLSAFSLAASRLGWPLQEVEMLSLHGRAVALIEPLVTPGAKLMALTEGDETVREVARKLVRRGYGRSDMHALQEMGGPFERMLSFSAEAVPEGRFSALTTLAIECCGDAGASLLTRTPGLPDEVFRHDGLITKREVRAVTLSALAPYPGALLWDVGAGCGSVAIEWIRAAARARAISFERDPDRLAMIAENAERLGAPALEIVAGSVPETLKGAGTPDAVFIGGAVAEQDVFEVAWAALRPGGRLVANAVTLEGEAHIARLHRQHRGELIRIDISHAEPVGAYRAMRPRLPVVQWRVTKP